MTEPSALEMAAMNNPKLNRDLQAALVPYLPETSRIHDMASALQAVVQHMVRKHAAGELDGALDDIETMTEEMDGHDD